MRAHGTRRAIRRGASALTRAGRAGRLAAAIVLVLLSAGCASISEEGRWTLMGSFTTARSDADMDAVCRAAGRTPPCAFLESYPEQFIFSFDTRRACEQARERIARVETARPGECEPPAPAPEAWVLRGAFTMERTREDVDAVCAIVVSHGAECRLMESFPERFAFRFASREACEAAAREIAAVPHVSADPCERARD